MVDQIWSKGNIPDPNRLSIVDPNGLLQTNLERKKYIRDPYQTPGPIAQINRDVRLNMTQETVMVLMGMRKEYRGD